ncbi:hypothetical protein MPTK1_1g05850 [Marchantia polymorpha subsp. ruderalis]|uniref:Uncharacterized protein n=2 Tax=Marchantia polymorpha TaxID=3197 RepID=A0AAF6ALY3_MARPO|nr:hypothetical protein MARPO_0005s0023 [Marchantia polymorpha]BBM97453.1 hypothetical protein Mp_1g05850 [Marchantia polymorpha subsp. ruderalis]|eukprot:PTQ48351.1 hypothetical protein MARPO_0005s0023 [Marchantia polymorpha]
MIDGWSLMSGSVQRWRTSKLETSRPSSSHFPAAGSLSLGPDHEHRSSTSSSYRNYGAGPFRPRSIHPSMPVQTPHSTVPAFPSVFPSYPI